MADTVDTLIARIKSVVSVSDADVLVELNWRHREMVARAKSYRQTVAVGNTVAGQADYPLNVVELYELRVGGVPWTRGRQGDDVAYSQGHLTWCDPNGGGLIVVEADASGVQGLRLIPTPDGGSAGVAITALAAVTPPDLVTGGAASTIKVDPDFYRPLCDGVCATFLRNQGEGDPASFEQIFDTACEELRQRVARRLRGKGPSQIRIVGVNA